MPGLTVLVTGGAGYIGSHCAVELLQAGYDVVALDNFVNSVAGPAGADTSSGRPRPHPPSLERVQRIAGRALAFYECDLLDKQRLKRVFQEHQIDCVIHFAAIKAVGESMQVPLLYYKNNLIATINLLEAMEAHGVHRLVFSSSCTVYGDPGPDSLPITEAHPTGAVTNVYGRTKHFIEGMLKDVAAADEKWNIIALRYFNPVGAHPSGLIGEDPTKEFTNIMPYMAQVAIGNKPHLDIFGGDYDTVDGTGVRDYIHVMDLASGHVAALLRLCEDHQRIRIYNLGTGEGVSVLQLLRTFEAVTQTKIAFKICDRREGDIVSMYADASLAEKELGWKAKFTLPQMCEDFWRWQTMNPDGYRSCSTDNGFSRHTSNNNGYSRAESCTTNGHSEKHKTATKQNGHFQSGEFLKQNGHKQGQKPDIKDSNGYKG